MPIQIKRGGSEAATPQPRVEYGNSSTGHHTTPMSEISSSAFTFEAAMEATELEDLLDQLYYLSDRLSVFPSGLLIAEYREILSELLRRITKGLRIKRDMRWRKTDRKMYVTIERTEKAMEELEEAFRYEGDEKTPHKWHWGGK